MRISFMLAGTALMAVAGPTFAARVPKEPVQVILVGDSTMQPRSGYGVQLCARFSAPAKCDLRARGGTSTTTYRKIGSWDASLKEVAEGRAAGFKRSYMLIQLGHNDGNNDEYRVNLGRYVDEAKAAGTIPVLITPVTPRNFKDGKLVTSMKVRADIVSEVGKQRGVPVLDLYALSAKYVQSIGPSDADYLSWVDPPAEVIAASPSGTSFMPARKPPATKEEIGAAKAAGAPPPTAAPPSFDYVHMNAKAGLIFSGMVAQELRRKVPKLAKYLVEPPAD